MVCGGLAVEDATDLGRAGEGELADARVLHQRVGHRHRVVGGQYLQGTGGAAGALPQLAQQQGRQWRLLGGLEHEGAAGRQGGRRLARDHRQREVPGRDAEHRADRLPDGHQALVGCVRGERLAVDALGLLGVPAHEARGVGDLAARLLERLAHLAAHGARQALLVGHHGVMPAHEHVGALEGAHLPPALEGVPGDLRGGAPLLGAAVGDLGHGLSGGRIGDGVGHAGVLPAVGQEATFDVLERFHASV